jgi:hypothetical protein
MVPSVVHDDKENNRPAAMKGDRLNERSFSKGDRALGSSQGSGPLSERNGRGARGTAASSKRRRLDADDADADGNGDGDGDDDDDEDPAEEDVRRRPARKGARAPAAEDDQGDAPASSPIAAARRRKRGREEPVSTQDDEDVSLLRAARDSLQQDRGRS